MEKFDSLKELERLVEIASYSKRYKKEDWIQLIVGLPVVRGLDRLAKSIDVLGANLEEGKG